MPADSRLGMEAQRYELLEARLQPLVGLGPSSWSSSTRTATRVLGTGEVKGLLREALQEIPIETRSDEELHEATKALDQDASGGVQKGWKQVVQHLMGGYGG